MFESNVDTDGTVSQMYSYKIPIYSVGKQVGETYMFQMTGCYDKNKLAEKNDNDANDINRGNAN